MRTASRGRSKPSWIRRSTLPFALVRNQQRALVQVKHVEHEVVEQTDRDRTFLPVSHCPECKIKMQTNDSRLYFNFGFPTVRRRRSCSKCEFQTTTIEIPFDMAKDIFNEEDE